jgi:hypothetical protein
VLDDGNIVRPVPVSRYTYRPVRRSREKSEAAEEKTKRKLRVRVLPRSSKRPSGVIYFDPLKVCFLERV